MQQKAVLTAFPYIQTVENGLFFVESIAPG
jgi:hypothetical protein